jgi:hypothetical protein
MSFYTPIVIKSYARSTIYTARSMRPTFSKSAYMGESIECRNCVAHTKIYLSKTKLDFPRGGERFRSL